MRLRGPICFALCCALLVMLSGTAAARVPSQTPRRALEGQVSRSLSAPAARGSIAGVLVERGGSPVIALNADRPLKPASLTKLATTSAALARFGVSHRFATRVVAGRAPAGGALTGSLVMVGGGDPAFVTEAYGRKRFIPKPDDPAPVPAFPNGFATVEDLADAVRAAGVRTVTGDLLVDESLFDSSRTQEGWIPDYQKKGDVDVGNLSALAVNEGFADIEGKLVAADPALNAGRLLKAALAARGVSVAGPVRYGRAPKGAASIARVLSPTVAEIVGFTNRYSVNYPAELLLKGMGAAFGGAGTTQAGVRVVTETLSKARIPVAGLLLTDGSGLSVLNRMTPRTIATVLRHALEDRSPAGQAMRDSMPVAGGPGTLLRRLREPPTVGNLRGKTGLIKHVRGMAGWVTGLDGSLIVYVTLFNDVARAPLLTGPIDLISLAVARFPYG